MNQFSLNGKTILITGASSGIGAATAIECANQGAHVVISGRNLEKLQAVYNQLSGKGHQTLACDLCSLEDVENLCDQLPEIGRAHV